MATKTLYTPIDGTPPQICLADFAGDFSPTGANDLRIGTDTEVQLSLASVADSAYRQSAKFDFGAHWAMEYFAQAAFELAATPTAGEAIYLYLSCSHTNTAGTGNAGGVSGSDSAYAGYSTNADAAIKQLQLISTFIVTAQATANVQIIDGWTFRPWARYGSIVVRNESGAAFHSDDVESHITLNPVVQEFQDT